MRWPHERVGRHPFRMKIAFIVQRYGAEILGGSEYHCRLVAERLARRHDVTVLTTCARDYITWKNEYPEGADRIRGVTVQRFANAKTRDIRSFNEFSDWIFHNPHSPTDEQSWLEQQGPWCPALLEHLEQRHGNYDALIFFTYLYAPTVLGLKIDPKRSILVPTAHDEPAIRLELYRDVFRAPAGFAFNTGVERAFLRTHFEMDPRTEAIVGCGVDLPARFLSGSETDGSAGASAPVSSIAEAALAGDDETGFAGAAPEEANGNQSGGRAPDALFRRRHRLYEPFALYGGRIDPGKGCEELIAHFGAYAEARGDASLVLMGVKLMPIPEEPYIRFAGTLPDAERFEALRAATVVVVPSPYESLSLLALEAFAVGTPVLANARSDVVTDHCQRSNAGLYYGDREEFVECLSLLIGNPELREAMGRNGQAYVETNYAWDVILNKYERLMHDVTAGRRRRRPSAGPGSASVEVDQPGRLRRGGRGRGGGSRRGGSRPRRGQRS